MNIKVNFALSFFILLAFALASCTKPIYDLPEYTNTENTNDIVFFDTAETFTFELSDDNTYEAQNHSVETFMYFHKYGDNLYFVDDSAICTFDEATGTFKHLCKDPLCSHTTNDCPYYGFNNSGISIYENYIYFYQDYHDYDFSNNKDIDVNRFVRVNLETNELEIMRDIDAGEGGVTHTVNVELYTDKYYYYYDVQEIEDTKKLEYVLKRQDLDSKEIKILNDFAYDNLYVFKAFVDGMIYWTDPMANAIFCSSNYDLSEPEVVFEFDDNISSLIYSDTEIIFRTVPENEGVLYSYDLESKTKKKLIELDNDNFVVTEKYVYYTGEVKRYEFGIDKRTEEIISLSDSVIWRVNRETLEKEEVFCLSDISPNCAIDYYYPSGNYIYAYFKYYDSESGSIQDSRLIRKLLRINVNTGELYLIDTPVYN